MSNQEWDQDQTKLNQAEPEPSKNDEEPEPNHLLLELERLEQLAKASPHSLVRLGDALFWEFKPRLDKIMLDVQNIVVSSIIKEKGKL